MTGTSLTLCSILQTPLVKRGSPGSHRQQWELGALRRASAERGKLEAGPRALLVLQKQTGTAATDPAHKPCLANITHESWL